MQEHLHTGFYNFLFAGVSAIVLMNLIRYAAIHLDDYPAVAGFARVIGATVSFSAPVA